MTSSPRTRLVAVLAAVATASSAMVAMGATAAPGLPAPTPTAACGPGSRPETGMQGEVPTRDLTSGRVAQGYYCNLKVVGHLPASGGYRVERYVDKQGHVCAFFDSGVAQLVHPLPLGVSVADMSDPTRPRLVRTLRTPGMLSPHEGMRLNQKRGLLVASTGLSGLTATGTLDVYSVAEDCTRPRLLAAAPLGVLGHESGFAPDGNTFWVSSNGRSLVAVDLRTPSEPTVLLVDATFVPHGLSVSEDGNTLYLAGGGGDAGLTIVDARDVQRRTPSPKLRLVSRLTWPERSIPQNATPFSSGGHQYVVETDELGGSVGPRGDTPKADGGPIGAARIIDIDDPRRPKVVSHLRLAVNNTGDGTYAAHYCSLPSRIDPAIIACGFVGSGLRVFDVRNPRRPREVAYANATDMPPGRAVLPNGTTDDFLSNVYSAPAYDPARRDIWYADATRGLMVARLPKGVAGDRFARVYRTPGS